MMAKVMSATLVGVDACRVTVEVDLIRRLPMMHTVGLPARAVKESEDRVRAAIGGMFEDFPKRRIIINLAPADLPKTGTGFDLPIAVGILRGWGKVEGNRADGYLMLGELGLDGVLRPVPGVLAAAQAAREGGMEGVVVPWANRAEASLVEGLEVVAASTLAEVIGFLNGAEVEEGEQIPCDDDTAGPAQWHMAEPDLAEVRGLEWPRLALEVAAAGGHNLMFVGPPGTGVSLTWADQHQVVPARRGQVGGEWGDGGRLCSAAFTSSAVRGVAVIPSLSGRGSFHANKLPHGPFERPIHLHRVSRGRRR